MRSRRFNGQAYERHCSRCDQWMPETEENFSFHTTRGAFNAWCKPCSREYSRQRNLDGGTRRQRRATARVNAAPAALVASATRRFGLEIEFVGSPVALEREMRARGLDCAREEYNHHNRSYWKIVPDGSVPGGAELVSPVLSGDAGRAQVRLACAALKAAGCGVDNHTGLHVHHDVNDLSLAQLRQVVSSWRASQGAIDAFVARSRRSTGHNNYYCQPLGQADMRYLENVRDLAAARRTLNSRSSVRYRSLNFWSYGKYGTVEVRQHQGTLEATKMLAWVDLAQAFIFAAATTAVADAGHATLLETLQNRGGLDEDTADYLTGRATRLERRAA